MSRRPHPHWATVPPNQMATEVVVVVVVVVALDVLIVFVIRVVLVVLVVCTRVLASR